MKTLEINQDPALEAANIRPVPKKFEREEIFRHELIWKEGPYAIYRYHYLKTDFDPPHWKYEAVIIRISEPHPKGTDRRLREALPSNSDWGRFGWSLNCLEKAHQQIASERARRGKVIESNYYSHFKNSAANSKNIEGLSPKTTIPHLEGANSPSHNTIAKRMEP